LAIEPGVDGGGFEGGDADEDSSPVVEEEESEDEDSTDPSVSVESSSSCAGGVSWGCLELTHRGAPTTLPLLTRTDNELENGRCRGYSPRRMAGATRSKAKIPLIQRMSGGNEKKLMTKLGVWTSAIRLGLFTHQDYKFISLFGRAREESR
jgi:hypothetical protein